MAELDPSESARAYLAYHLKRLREEHELTQTQLGAKIYVSGSLISGIETMQRRATHKNLRAFDRTFGLDQFFAPLYQRVLDETGLPAGFPEYADAESETGMLRTYQNFVFHGLLQTPDYARAVLRGAEQPSKLEKLVEERMERQAVLSREDPPLVVAMFDESVLHRRFGGREVIRGQLERVLELSELTHIQIHIVPGESDLCPEGAFTLLSSPGEPNIAYVEMAGGWGQLVDEGEYVASLGILFERIRSKALPAEDSRIAIRTALEEL